jgi:hypothetical protein
MSDDLRELLDKQAIREMLYRYCRGVDRLDRALTRACWHDDGTADYPGLYEGGADGLVDAIWAAHDTMQTHSHQMTNMLIEIACDRAVSETYVTVALRTRSSERDILTRGRYVDRWSRRDGRWGIDHRHYVSDWMNYVDVSDLPASEQVGRRDEDDPSYAAFAALRKS